MNWSKVGAVAGVFALIEAPLFLLLSAGWHWTRSVDRRLKNLESHLGIDS